MSIIKKPYEISIWRDKLIYIGKDGNAYDSLQDMTNITTVDYQYYDEERLAVIGSDVMTSPARVVNPIFKKNINGTETLTFDMYYQYEDIESGEIIRNPLIDFVIDERKVKLFYEDQWYDFIVKKDDEKGRDYKYSYTCTGLAANELGKTGFNIELDTDLENNMGTVTELGKEVLRGSDWQLRDEDQEIIKQTNEEALYSLVLTSPITNAKLLNSDSSFGTINEGKRIYVYYTSFANQEKNYFQFIYVNGDTGTAIPDLLEDGVTINCNNTRTYDLYMNGIQWYNGYPDFCFKEAVVDQEQFEANKTRYWYYTEEDGYVQCTSDSEYDSGKTYYITAVAVADYRGLRYVRKQLSAYDPVLKQTVLKYTRNNTEYYGYTTTDYIDSTTVQNYIYNSTNFSGTSYWGIYGDSNNKSISAEVFPSVKNNVNATRAGYLVVQFGNTNARLVNDGIIQNYSKIDRFTKGEKYRLKVCVGTTSGNTFTPLLGNNVPFNCIVKKYKTIDVDTPAEDHIYFNSTGITPIVSGNYTYIDMECLESATWEDLKSLVGIFFIPKNNSDTKYYIKDIQFYKYIIGQNNQPIAPDDPVENLPDVRIETKYHFYDPTKNIGKLSEEDYVFSESNPSLYEPLFGSGNNKFEKIRSIIAKESNRFNLLQELSETFECWVKFKIEHKDNGQIQTETFPYYNLVNLVEGASATGYYIYDWYTRQYIEQPSGAVVAKGQKYYQQVNRTRQIKKVVFYKEILVDNYAGFKYGINLKDNNRTLDSEQIVTKIIVKDNTCEQAENGFCSIARAEDNPIKENFAYNFDYYTSQGLINQSTLNNDLYLEITGSVGLYPRLSRLNKERNQLIDSAAPLANSISDLTSKYQVAQLQYDSAEKDLQRMLDPQSGTIYQYTHYVYDDFYNQYGRKGTAVNVNVPSYKNEIYFIKASGLTNITANNGTLSYYIVTADTAPVSGKTYYYISSSVFTQLNSTKFRDGCVYYEKLDSARYTANTYMQTGTTTTTLTFTGSGSPEIYIYNAARRRMDDLGAEDFINDNFTISTLEKITTQQANKDSAQNDMQRIRPDLDATQAQYDSIQDQLKTIANATDEVEKEFNVKYARYVQEGSWTDDNYMDDDLYYLDSLSVLYQSAYPKVSYNFNVLDLSQLEGYEGYKFDIGQKTYVEDTEFFGYQIIGGLRTPVKEQVVVTEYAKYLDENDKNQIKIQNYKSHFEDLFQRITAATQTLEYHSGEYAKAAGIVTPTGELSQSVVQRSLATSNYVITNSHDQSVVWDETGIHATNLSDPMQITRLSSAGILVSADGGNSWGVAISGYGINTSYLTAGQIDADKINIMSGAYPTFKWDSLGLRAYGFTADDNGNILSYDPSKYVAHDRFGIYGIDGLTNKNFKTVQDVKDNAVFGLTWDGLFIKSVHRDGYVSISSEDDITLKEYYQEGNQKLERIRGKFGLLSGGDDNSFGQDIYGLALYSPELDENNEPVPTVETKSDGTLWLKSQMDIGTNNSNQIYLGVGTEQTQEHGYKVFKVYGNRTITPGEEGEENTDRFIVYEDGTLKARGVEIEGAINASSGTIGPLSISAIPQTLGVRIIQNDGDTFRLDENGEGTPWMLSFNYSTSFESVSNTSWLFGTKPNTSSEPYNMNDISNNIDNEGNIILYYYTDSTKTNIGYNKVTLTSTIFNKTKTRYYYKDGNDYIQCTSSSSYDSSKQYYIKVSELFNGGLAYLRCEVISGGQVYQSQISIKLERDGKSADAYTYYIESSKGYVINTNTTFGNTTQLTASFYKNGEVVPWTGHTITWQYKSEPVISTDETTDETGWVTVDLDNSPVFSRVTTGIDYIVNLDYLNIDSIQIRFIVD